MATFNFDYWWALVGIEDLTAKMQLGDWFIRSGLTTRDALIALDFQSLEPGLLLGWDEAIMISVKRLGELSHRYFYHAPFIQNAASFCIGV